MKRRYNILLALGFIVTGWLLNAYAWTTDNGHPVSTAALVLGSLFFIIGLILLLRPRPKKNEK